VKHHRCYICYEITDSGEDYHKPCLFGLFHIQQVPIITFNEKEIDMLALEYVNHKMGIPGVQKKLSLSLQKPPKNSHLPSRLTLVGSLGGEYILKPPSTDYPHMPEIEDLTMHLASIANIEVAQHGLIVIPNNKLAYVTKRFDRKGKEKIAVEDLCQLSLKLTKDKYKSSTEKVGEVIRYYCSNPGSDMLKYFELIIFCFLTGNADMHLKNFMLITQNPKNIRLSPCYDLLATRLLIPKHVDPEELALPVNGKKSNLRKKDFIALGKNLNIPEKTIQKSLSSLIDNMPIWFSKINQSFLPEALKEKFQLLIEARAQQIA